MAFLAIVVLPSLLLWPWLRDLSTWGFQDWDVQAAHRFLVRESLLRFGQFPGWNPYACGGFPAWGYVEADTNLVSPWLPLYLLFDLRVALRVEVLGMTVLGAAGTWLVAGHYTRSLGARLLVVALFAVNGRWALQASVGHTWHLCYALLPWCLYLFDRACEGAPSATRIAALSTVLALLVYWGGVYPLPHAALILGALALGRSLLARSARPSLVLLAAGLLGLCLAAPKLLPILSAMQRAPRLIDSTEVLDPAWLRAILTARDQGFHMRPVRAHPYGWHEWGMYLGVAGVVAILVGVLAARGRREILAAAIGALLLALAFGAVGPFSPWTWLHGHLPVFRSQHVPSRFLYPASLLLGLAAAGGIGRLVERASRRVPWLDAGLVALAFTVGVDVTLVGREAMVEAMSLEAPPAIPRAAIFRQAARPPYRYRAADGAAPMYLSMLGNVGVIDCYGTPPFDDRGALATTDPRYRGEVEVDGGSARVDEWTPNRVVLSVERAMPGARLVYNMNYDPGWSATLTRGAEAQPLSLEPDHHRVACALPAGASRIVLRYSPPGFRLGLAFLGLSVAGLLWAMRRQRRSA